MPPPCQPQLSCSALCKHVTLTFYLSLSTWILSNFFLLAETKLCSTESSCILFYTFYHICWRSFHNPYIQIPSSPYPSLPLPSPIPPFLLIKCRSWCVLLCISTVKILESELLVKGKVHFVFGVRLLKQNLWDA